MRMAGPDFWDPFREDRHIQLYRGQRATRIELQTTGGRSEIRTNSVGIAGGASRFPLGCTPLF